MTTKYTIDDIMAMYAEVDRTERHRETLVRLWAGQEALTARQIAALDTPIWSRVLLLKALLPDIWQRKFCMEVELRDLERHIEGILDYDVEANWRWRLDRVIQLHEEQWDGF